MFASTKDFTVFSDKKIGHAKFNFVDTPALEDAASFGPEKIKKLKDLLANFGGVNCVCVVIDGNKQRM